MFGLIMIGGRGTRFWPLSKIARPKQLIDFSGKGEMIKITVDRVRDIIEPENFFIVTSKNIVEPVKKILPDISNIIGEPSGKNTAPCIAMITGMLLKNHSEDVISVFPGDHFIEKQNEFIDCLKIAESAARKDKLVTIGIKPDFPHTGYGYIEFKKSDNKYCEVIQFFEKPDKQTAENFLKAGNFLWNAGIFVWKIKTIADAFKKYQPLMYESILKISNAEEDVLEKIIIEEYAKMPKISIDYAIMEPSKNIVTVPAVIGWNDIGSWSALSNINKADENGNVLLSDKNIIINSRNNIVHTKNKLVALVDVENIIVAADENSILVCSKKSDQKVGDVVKKLESLSLNDYV